MYKKKMRRHTKKRCSKKLFSGHPSRIAQCCGYRWPRARKEKAAILALHVHSVGLRLPATQGMAHRTSTCQVLQSTTTTRSGQQRKLQRDNNYEPHTAKAILQRKKGFLSNHRLKFFYREMLLLSTQRSGKCSFKGKRCRLGNR